MEHRIAVRPRRERTHRPCCLSPPSRSNDLPRRKHKNKNKNRNNTLERISEIVSPAFSNHATRKEETKTLPRFGLLERAIPGTDSISGRKRSLFCAAHLSSKSQVVAVGSKTATPAKAKGKRLALDPERREARVADKCGIHLGFAPGAVAGTVSITRNIPHDERALQCTVELLRFLPLELGQEPKETVQNLPGWVDDRNGRRSDRITELSWIQLEPSRPVDLCDSFHRKGVSSSIRICRSGSSGGWYGCRGTTTI